MKSKEEILIRSVIILFMSDRYALEESVIGGISYPFDMREKQRDILLNWLKDKGYFKHMTEDEKQLYELKIGKVNKIGILGKQFEHGALEPCLWSLGLAKVLSDYNDYVLDDFHPTLQIGFNHKFEDTLKSCRLKSEEDISLQTEIAMLWYWRAIEYNAPIFNKTPVQEIIRSVFGEQYNEVLDHIKEIKKGKNDFVVNKKLFRDLDRYEAEKVRLMAQWRYHAFVWMMGDEDWDNVELDT